MNSRKPPDGSAYRRKTFPKTLLIREFDSPESIKRLWWLHDSFWHAALVKALGHEEANRFNLEANEKIFRMLTLMLLREGLIRRPRSIRELMQVFKSVWKNAFFDDLYINEPIEYDGNTALWTGTRCHAFDSLNLAGMTSNYACGCQALRNGVMRALHLKPIHRIKKSLMMGDDQCVIEITFAKERE